MNRVGTGLVAGLLLAALFAVPANADPENYGSNGVFGVGAEPPEGWATASIPPGFWLRCNDFPCAGNLPGHIVASGEAVRDQPTFVDILPTDVAVSLNNVTLTVAG